MAVNQSGFLDIEWDNRSIELEFSFIGAEKPNDPLIIFLHEGLGSVSQWKDFPNQLCRKTGSSGLVYSRPGYGRSTPFDPEVFWGADFMHRQAFEVLPKLISELKIYQNHQRVWLFGHSDGASIALLYSSVYPAFIEGLVLVAPHVMVEDITVESIKRLTNSYKNEAFREKFAIHHRDPDSTFNGWSQVWLSPKFRSWSIESELQNIRSPVFVIQGADDEYGTSQQIAAISNQLPGTESFEIAGCGHAPHRTHLDELLGQSARFIQRISKNQQNSTD